MLKAIHGKIRNYFNIRLSNHVKKPDAILACRHFPEKKPVFDKHTKFIIIDKFTNTTKLKDILPKIDWKSKLLDSNAANATTKSIKTRTYYLIKML